MKLKLDDNYQIATDDKCFMLQHKNVISNSNTKGRKANPANIGKETWNTIGYYGNIQHAFNGYAKFRLLYSKCQSFKELYDLLAEIKKLIKALPDVDNLQLQK
jgi:hypothetical protein